MEPSGLSAVRRGHPQRPQYGQTLVQNGALRAVSRRASATETPVRTDTCTEWSPPGCQLSGEGTHRDPGMGCQPSGEGTHRDPGTDRHLYRMEPSGLSAVRRGHIQRPQYGQTLVQNGALWAVAVRRGLQRPRYGQTLVQNGALGAVSCQVRAPTETLVWGCQPSGEGTHRDPGTDRHLYRMEPFGLSAVRRGHIQRTQYGQTLVQNGGVSRQERAPTETPVRAISPQARAPTETPVRTDTCTEWSPPGCQPSGEGYRDPGTDRHLYRIDPSELSAVR
ncbi:hypothetical protein NDU88_006672 [Pleurodeles waltl]|uniref:Uncharacterized protein n=1 Tax=Pleurodeles waltl TaxID=8319 RepID=A0AAV7L4B7_PLEWA|nr:hypothetical protein NDU88_006672 [Pleurodeles waltl]